MLTADVWLKGKLPASAERREQSSHCSRLITRPATSPKSYNVCRCVSPSPSRAAETVRCAPACRLTCTWILGEHGDTTVVGDGDIHRGPVRPQIHHCRHGYDGGNAGADRHVDRQRRHPAYDGEPRRDTR